MFGQSADKTDREFQTFAFVDRHDPHNIRILIKDIRLPEINLLLLYGFQIPDKVEQSVKTGILKCARLLEQQSDIGDSLVASRHGAHIGIV